MRLYPILMAIIAGHASAQCVPGDYMQYKDKATGTDGVKALAGDLCMVKLGFRSALAQDKANATMRDPANMKHSNACVAEIKKITDAAKAAGIGQEVEAMSKAICPGK